MRIKQAALVAIVGLSLIFCASRQNKLARSREKDPQYQYNMGLFYINNNNIDEAMKYLKKCLSLNPRYFLAWNAIGLAQSIKGDLAASAASFEKCLAIDPQFTEARNNLGTIYQELNFIDKAEQQFKTALRDPNYASRELPYYNLARLCFATDRLDDALDNLRKAVQIKPRFAMAFNLMGMVLEKKGDLEEAISSYEQAVKFVPEEPNFGYNLGLAYYKNAEYVKAKPILEKAAPQILDPEMSDKIKETLASIKTKEKPQ